MLGAPWVSRVALRRIVSNKLDTCPLTPAEVHWLRYSGKSTPSEHRGGTQSRAGACPFISTLDGEGADMLASKRGEVWLTPPALRRAETGQGARPLCASGRSPGWGALGACDLCGAKPTPGGQVSKMQFWYNLLHHFEMVLYSPWKRDTMTLKNECEGGAIWHM